MFIRVPDQRKTPGGYSALDDRLLVLDFQAGNPQAFVEIHHRYGALARHVCQRFLPGQQDADEAFQETMIRVFQGLYRFNGRYALQPWIARIAKNVSLDILRGHARRPKTDHSAPANDELPVPGDEADDIVERLVQRDTVLAVLADLPDTHRRALMLRELEGCSHREVAHELEMTPSQAKALIHRAKASFRRHWLEKVADRGGFMALAFLPLLWAARFGNFVRKFVDRAGTAAQTAQAAAPETVTSTVNATASAAAPAASGVAERVVAAGMTILLAGGVTVGAARIVNDKRAVEPAAEPKAQEIVVAAPDRMTTLAAESQDRPSIPLEARLETQTEGIGAEPPVMTEPDPSPVAEPSSEAEAEPEPSPSPEVETPEETTPPLVPAPAWTGSFDVDWPSEDACGCPAGLSILRSVTRGTLGVDPTLEVQDVAFAGAAADAEGDGAWRLQVGIRGSLKPDAGEVTLAFTLQDEMFTNTYVMTGDAASVEGAPGNGSPVIYRFEGPYGLAGAITDTSPIPIEGRVVLTIGIWSDGATVYATGIEISR